MSLTTSNRKYQIPKTRQKRITNMGGFSLLCKEEFEEK
jgi:hypothetical protein